MLLLLTLTRLSGPGSTGPTSTANGFRAPGRHGSHRNTRYRRHPVHLYCAKNCCGVPPVRRPPGTPTSCHLVSDPTHSGWTGLAEKPTEMTHEPSELGYCPARSGLVETGREGQPIHEPQQRPHPRLPGGGLIPAGAAGGPERVGEPALHLGVEGIVHLRAQSR